MIIFTSYWAVRIVPGYDCWKCLNQNPLSIFLKWTKTHHVTWRSSSLTNVDFRASESIIPVWIISKYWLILEIALFLYLSKSVPQPSTLVSNHGKGIYQMCSRMANRSPGNRSAVVIEIWKSSYHIERGEGGHENIGLEKYTRSWRIKAEDDRVYCDRPLHTERHTKRWHQGTGYLSGRVKGMHISMSLHRRWNCKNIERRLRQIKRECNSYWIVCWFMLSDLKKSLRASN